MDKEEVHRRKRMRLVSVLATADSILCWLILILLLIAIDQRYQGWIYRYKIVEMTSLVSSLIGFYLVGGLLLARKVIGTSFPGNIKPQKICIREGLLHLVCALSLYLYFASSYGYAMIVLGHIYREYGYVQLANAAIFLLIFIYFVRSSKSSVHKHEP